MLHIQMLTSEIWIIPLERSLSFLRKSRGSCITQKNICLGRIYEGDMVNNALNSPTLCNTPWIQRLYWCAKEQQQQLLWWWAIKYLPAAAVC